MRIIGYHAADEIIANSDGEVCTDQPFVDFLLEPKPDSIKVFRHMGYSVANILRMLNFSENEAKQLQADGEIRVEPYLVKYRERGFANFKKGYYRDSPYAGFSDVNQYEPVDLGNIPMTIEGCIKAAKDAQRIGEEVYWTLKWIGLEPKSLISPVNTYEKQILAKMGLPTIDDMPEEAGMYAYECCQGNWLEAYQIGHWDEAYDYDIISAYPSELMKLLDLRLGEWKKSESWIEEAEYAFCKGVVTNWSPLSPIIYRGKDLSYTPTGTWDRYLAKQKIEFLRRYRTGKFDMVDGWFWIPKEKQKPLYSTIATLYWEKEKREGISRDVVKRVMSGIWGKMLQTTFEGFGDLFNPAWGAEVESNTRVNVAKFVLDSGIIPIHISVDGVTFPMRLELENKSRIAGSWELVSAAPTICTGTAAVAIQGKKRGADFSIDYDWLMEQIKENPEAKEYSISKMAPVTMSVALNNRDWGSLGQLRKITKSVYMGGEPKRYYKEEPKCGRELLSRTYRSEPWDVSLLSNPIE